MQASKACVKECAKVGGGMGGEWVLKTKVRSFRRAGAVRVRVSVRRTIKQGNETTHPTRNTLTPYDRRQYLSLAPVA